MKKDQDKDIVRPYVVDGIEEYDNPLPSWWVGLFWGTIVFGLGYLLWFHVMKKPGLDAELTAQRQAFEEQKQALQAANGGADSLEQRLKDPKAVAEGKAIFATNCAACHGQLGEGSIGPNLTDDFWIHGGGPDAIVATVTNGVPAKGMIAWESTLGVQNIEKVVAYVLSLKGSNPPNAKAPQGDEYKD